MQIFELVTQKSGENSLSKQSLDNIIDKLSHSLVLKEIEVRKLDDEEFTQVIENLKVVHAELSLNRKESYDRDELFRMLLDNNFDKKITSIKVLDGLRQ